MELSSNLRSKESDDIFFHFAVLSVSTAFVISGMVYQNKHELLMVQKSHFQPPGMYKTIVNNGIFTIIIWNSRCLAPGGAFLCFFSGDSRNRLHHKPEAKVHRNGETAHGKSKTSSVWDTSKWKVTNVCASNNPNIYVYQTHVYVSKLQWCHMTPGQNTAIMSLIAW